MLPCGSTLKRAVKHLLMFNLHVFSSVYEWSTVLPCGSTLKRAVDCVICSICHVHPEFFTCLLEWMGIIINMDINASIPDDHKDSSSTQYQHHQEQESMTDDSKEASGALSQPMGAAASGHMIDNVPMVLQEFGHMVLDESHLTTLAIACQSQAAMNQLLDCGFPAVLAQGLFEFCSREILRYSDSMNQAEAFPDLSKSSSSSSSPRRRSRTSSTSSLAAGKESHYVYLLPKHLWYLIACLSDLYQTIFISCVCILFSARNIV